MKTVIEMVRQAGEVLDKEWLERFAELVRAEQRNATLDEIATKIEAMPFGDTAASFAVWIREQGGTHDLPTPLGAEQLRH